jgi:MFS family permease
METMFGVGLMIGPFLGSVLYELGGFYLPFVVCGAALAVCPVVAVFCIGGTNGTETVSA